MLRSFATSATPARGLYTVWSFNFDTTTPLAIDFHGDTNFVRELPAVFELVEAVDKAWHWSGDRDYIADADFTSFARNATTTFVDTHDSKIPNGAVKVAEGVSGNIFEGVASYNENGEGLIEAGDGVGSQYRAYLAAADLAAAGGDLRGAVANGIRAEALKLYFNRTWSDRPGVTPLVRGYSLSGATAQPVGGWGKENSWFMPMKRIVAPGPRLDGYLDFIDAQATDPATRPSNIEALTYLPDTFFPYQRDATAWKWMQYIYDQRNNPHPVAAQGTNGNYPETSFTLVSQTVQGLLGVDPDAAQGLVTASVAPASRYRLAGGAEHPHRRRAGHGAAGWADAVDPDQRPGQPDPDLAGRISGPQRYRDGRRHRPAGDRADGRRRRGLGGRGQGPAGPERDGDGGPVAAPVPGGARRGAVEQPGAHRFDTVPARRRLGDDQPVGG